jgi:hypothetical protein
MAIIRICMIFIECFELSGHKPQRVSRHTVLQGPQIRLSPWCASTTHIRSPRCVLTALRLRESAAFQTDACREKGAALQLAISKSQQVVAGRLLKQRASCLLNCGFQENDLGWGNT